MIYSENPLFNTLDEGAEATLNMDDVYESTHDDFDDLDNNSIKLDAEKQEVYKFPKISFK